MYPNAGDVQAPTPSPYASGPASGIGFFNKGDQPVARHHNRTKSGREIFHGPPGSYGLHGHGIIPKDEFEQQWYAKHPQDFQREKQGEYGHHIKENRKDYHWVGDDLVKLVHQSASKGHGMGTSRDVVSTPDEQIGYLATDQYASRITSPKPASGRPPSISKGKGGSVSIESPLHQSSFPAGTLQDKDSPEIVSDAEENIIHINPPSRRQSKIHGGSVEDPKMDLGPHAGNTEEEGGWIVEHGYGAPILASDELAKNPEAEYLQPAVSPELDRHEEEHRTHSRSHSRNSSRNNTARLGGTSSQRILSPAEHERNSTPLDNVKEYEPLFPEDEDEKKPAKSAVDKLKRPETLARHHFPSQDVWEDTPSSLQLETTVETPDVPEEEQSPPDVGPAKYFEKPEDEKKREKEAADDKTSNFLSDHNGRFAKPHFNKDIVSDMAGGRPGIRHRFPSQDIWEDAADHHHLVTTVSGPQEEEEPTEETTEPLAADKPQIPVRPQKSKETSPVDKKPPVLPDRPKPTVPTRPARPSTNKSTEKVPTTSTSAAADSLTENLNRAKPKPTIPARPAGSKIAALQAGFLKDLNSKLGLGPQAPKPKEPEPEKEAEQAEVKPLSDARKGRAKGPQRRKPAASPAAKEEVKETVPQVQKLEFAGVSTVWSIGEDGDVDVPAKRMAGAIEAVLKSQHVEKEAEAKEESEPGEQKETKQDPEAAKPESEEEKDDDEPERQGSGIFGAVKKAVETVASPITGSKAKDDEKVEGGEEEEGLRKEVVDEKEKESAPAAVAPDAAEKEEKTPDEVKEVELNVDAA
jgi:hypothetical protein